MFATVTNLSFVHNFDISGGNYQRAMSSCAFVYLQGVRGLGV